MLIYDYSCEGVCNWKAFVDTAKAGRHRGWSTIYNKQNLFHQSKLGRDVQLQNTHIVLFKSTSDLMRVCTLSAQLGLWLELSGWHRDATSVPYGHLLNGLSPRTDKRSRYCTNSGPIPWRFRIPDPLKQSKFLDDEHTNVSTLQVFQSFSRKSEFFFLRSWPKEFNRFLCECIVKLLKRNLQSMNRHHVTKVQTKSDCSLWKDLLRNKEETLWHPITGYNP